MPSLKQQHRLLAALDILARCAARASRTPSATGHGFARSSSPHLLGGTSNWVSCSIRPSPRSASANLIDGRKQPSLVAGEVRVAAVKPPGDTTATRLAGRNGVA